ncbi:MAG: S-layer homology domain-containing protein [Eubacteriales bacterium]
MKRKFTSLLLVFVMIFSLIPGISIPVSASSDSDMDALTALGIDTSKAPNGYDPNSTDNPYGRSTIQVSPVYELYTVGLKKQLNYASTYSTTKDKIHTGDTFESYIATDGENSLMSSLFGNEAWDKTSVSAIMSSGATSKIKDGSTSSQGDYTLIASGTVASGSTANVPANGYLKEAVNASTDLGDGFKYALSSVTAGNFDGNTSGLSAQTVMVYTSDYSNSGGLHLRFGSAENGTYGSNAKELLPTSKKIGNPDLTYEGKLVENFAEAPYQLQNYLQTATGDWNGDGLDEVAVYIPEQGNSRIVVYALQLTSSDDKATAYLDSSKWAVVWTYYLREGDVVSNMVSFTNGDVNEDGIDDLAATWGYYYGPDQNKGSTAVVMFGAKGTQLFNESQQFDLTFGSSNIVRGSFAFGDMAGGGSDVLILCGQSDADLKEGNTYSRYVALYSWDGAKFTSNVYNNFDLFENDEGEYVWSAMKLNRAEDILYSLPLCASNTAVISQGISGGGDLLYFDSLVIEYTDKGLGIKEAWDNQSVMQQNASTPVEYVEYGAVAGDLTGRTGTGAVFTMMQTLSSTTEKTASYTVTGNHQEPIYESRYYYKNWFYKLFKIKTYYTVITGYRTVTDQTTINANYAGLDMGKAYMVAVDPHGESSYYYNRTQADFGTAICLANTDNDSSYMNYTGRHYYTYTDPKVLAVLASPPYFSDLLNRDDLSGNYSESTTSYSSTSGSGGGHSVTATISLGAYVSYEQDIKVFGVTVASVEAEAAIISNFTFDTEKTSTLEQTVTYSATSGEDMVSFYSIPLEIYEYESYVPDGNGGYKKVLTTVNIPHEAAIRLLSMAEYDSIAKDYSVLPIIEDNVLTHTIGDPSTYPSGTSGYNVIAQYKGTPTAVGYSSTGGGSSISQEIAMSNETSSAFSASVAVEAKAGAGAGGFKVGVIAGAEAGAGTVSISTNGSSFSGEMQNMPIEAQPYGYGMNWKIFSYKYSNGKMTFPVVSYIVSDVQNPPTLPADFEQDITQTTSISINLKWSYNKTVAGFRLYRYFEFPDGSGSYELDFVPFTKATSYDSTTGTYSFSYTDDNLSPYTEYKYQIQTIQATNPKESIYSEPMICRTKTEVGYPVISLSGLNTNGQLPLYPDADSITTVSVENPETYYGLSYQWQKLVNGIWTDISGKTTVTFKVSNAGAADKGMYRCRVNTIYYDTSTATNYYISAYSDPFTTVYSKRTPTYDNEAFIVSEKITTDSSGSVHTGLNASIELYSAIKNHSVAPSGNVTFMVKGTDYEYSTTVALATSSSTKYLGDGEKYYSTATVSLTDLPVGVYTVTAYYSGSRIFKDMETRSGALVVIGNGSDYRLKLSKSDNGSAVTQFTYGENIFPVLTSISKEEGQIKQTVETGITYKLAVKGATTKTDFIAESPTPNVGSYTLEAYKNSIIVASQDFTVSKKPITVKIEDKSNVSANDVTSNPPVMTCNELSVDELAALKLTYKALNSAGNVAELKNGTDPGNYYVTACTSEGSDGTPALLYNNYSVAYESGTYTIIGATYRLTVTAAQYTDKSGTRTVGTAGISNAMQTFADYSSGTAVHMYATPYDGYEVDSWTAVFKDNTTKTQIGQNNFIITTEAQMVDVTVTFKPAMIKLSTVTQPVVGGVVTCSDELFSSGAVVGYGAEFTFTATPAQGYHFNKWQTVSGGTTSTYDGQQNPNGSSSLEVTVGRSSMSVYALFERDYYTLTLEGDITAYYMFDDDDNSTTPMIRKTLVSGTSVKGDTEITVEPKTGYQAADGKFITVNNIATSDNTQHIFSITKNTTVSLETTRNKYSVNVEAENGTVASTVSGLPVSNDMLDKVEGGSSLSFTAQANRGYVFDHWEVDGNAVANSTSTFTIGALGGNTTVKAVFTDNTPYTVNAAVSAASRGTMKYTLYDIYGTLVGEANSDMPSGGLEVYKGESIVLSVVTNNGSMMEQWNVNGTVTYATSKTYTVNPISSDITATAYLKAASSYVVYFVAMGSSGSTLTGKADDIAFTSGSLQSGGSELAFTANPADGYMLDYWTVTNGDLTTTENTSSLKDADGNTMILPTYLMYPLKQNITVRAHFIALTKNNIKLPDSSTAIMGDSTITYVTPIIPTDNGVRNVSTDKVRSGGEVRMSFIPKDGYGTDVDKIKELLEGKVNTEALVSVEKDEGVYKATVKNINTALELAETDIYYQVYGITVPKGVKASVNNAPQGVTVTLTVTPEVKYKLSALTLSKGSLNEVVSSSRLSYTFEMPDSEVIVSVTFEQSIIGGGGDIGGGDIGGGGTGGDTGDGEEEEEEEKEYIDLPASGDGNDIKASVSIKDRTASVKIDDETLDNVSDRLSLDLASFDEIDGVALPSSLLYSIQDKEIRELSVTLPDAQVTFDLAAIRSIPASSSKNVTLSVSMVDNNTLTADQQALIGDRPVVSMILSEEDNIISNFGSGSVQVKLPYTLKADEDPEKIVVWYLNNAGVLEHITGKYDPVSKSVVFTTNHFSNFVIGYLPFKDVSEETWYYNSVSFAYANNIFGGTTATEFNPEMAMTRSMFVTVLWRLDEKPSAKTKSSFKDVKEGEWYTEAVSWAVENGIVQGYGDGLFGTNDSITREQLAVMLMNYARYKEYGLSTVTVLSTFRDSEKIVSWARNSMRWATGEGYLGDTGNMYLLPQGEATRAEVAEILRRFVMKAK